jgi:hypothetical protein
VVERLRPAELYERFAVYRRALGLELLPLDDGTETLRGGDPGPAANRLACLVCDRDLTGGGWRCGCSGPGGHAGRAGLDRPQDRGAAAALLRLPRPPARALAGRGPPPLVPELTGDTRKDTLP